MDRTSGEVLSAETFAYANTTFGVDLKTGKLKINPDKVSGFNTIRDACPAPPGGKDWQPSAFSPKTGLVYIPHNNLCYENQGLQANAVIIPLVLSAFLYARGSRRERSLTPRQKACFWSGWSMLVVALVSPLHPLGEELFSAQAPGKRLGLCTYPARVRA